MEFDWTYFDVSSDPLAAEALGIVDEFRRPILDLGFEHLGYVASRIELPKWTPKSALRRFMTLLHEILCCDDPSIIAAITNSDEGYSFSLWTLLDNGTVVVTEGQARVPLWAKADRFWPRYHPKEHFFPAHTTAEPPFVCRHHRERVREIAQREGAHASTADPMRTYLAARMRGGDIHGVLGRRMRRASVAFVSVVVAVTLCSVGALGYSNRGARGAIVAVGLAAIIAVLFATLLLQLAAPYLARGGFRVAPASVPDLLSRAARVESCRWSDVETWGVR